jgi:hypothetical protein
MCPTRFQRLFTDHRPFAFCAVCGATVAVIWELQAMAPYLALLSFWDIAWLVVLLPFAACLGAALGVFPTYGILGGLVLDWVARRNGAPFREGDEVVILSKRFPGRVTRVYEVWNERRQVRVELGEQEREAVTDVFEYTDVCRPPRGPST